MCVKDDVYTHLTFIESIKLGNDRNQFLKSSANDLKNCNSSPYIFVSRTKLEIFIIAISLLEIFKTVID